jgi:hypothetical protein
MDDELDSGMSTLDRYCSYLRKKDAGVTFSAVIFQDRDEIDPGNA